MTTGQKFWISIAGSFLLGLAQYYSGHNNDAFNLRFWLGAFFAAISPVAAYLVGYAQINPNNQPKTLEQFLKAIESAGDTKIKEDLRNALLARHF